MSIIIIYGLGNNESKYLKTKHNAGRLVVEKIASDWGVPFVESSQDCFVAKKKLDSNNEFWLVYSKGYMNHSGLPISKLLKYYKVNVDFQLIIAQDDSDQILGKTKLVSGGGTAGHNGIIF